MNGLSALVHRLQIARVAREAQLAAARTTCGARARIGSQDGREPGPLRILAWTLSYPPDSRGGSEVTLHDVLLGLGERGFIGRVLMPRDGTTYRLDDIEVTATRNRRTWYEHATWCDILIAQLDRQRPFVLAEMVGKPFVFWFHIGNVRRSSMAGKPALTVFTSDALRARNAWIAPATVVHPPIRAQEYLVTPGTSATCINLSKAKGGELLFDLARQMPDREFLGIESWGEQVRPQIVPPNCEVLPTQQDMRDVYGRTRVLLVPSVYEAYGRVALEAAVSGIPAVAHPSAGLREAMGDAVLWADRGDPDAWVRHLRDLDDPGYYAERAAIARKHFEQLDPDVELDSLAEQLSRLVRGTTH